LGQSGLQFLERILADGLSFAQLADRTGKGGERGSAYVGERFRWMLGELADTWAAKGRVVR